MPDQNNLPADPTQTITVNTTNEPVITPPVQPTEPIIPETPPQEKPMEPLVPPTPTEPSKPEPFPEATDTPFPLIDENGNTPTPSTDIPPTINEPQPKKKFLGGKIIPTILGLLILIGGVSAGVFLVKQQQELRSKAGEGWAPIEPGTPKKTVTAIKKLQEYYDSGGKTGVMTGGDLTTIKEVPEEKALQDALSAAQAESIPVKTCGSGGGTCTAQANCANNNGTNDVLYSWKGDTSCGVGGGCCTPVNSPSKIAYTCRSQSGTCLVDTYVGIEPDYDGEYTTLAACQKGCIDLGHITVQSGDIMIGEETCKEGETFVGRIILGKLEAICTTKVEDSDQLIETKFQSCKIQGLCLYLRSSGNTAEFCGNCSGTGGSGRTSTTGGGGGGGGGSGTPVPTPTPTVINQCLNIKIFDTSWNEISTSSLATLTAGTKIRFTVAGSPTASFDKAKFVINGTEKEEVTAKRPSTNEYYYEYTLPSGIINFAINAKLHLSASNQWI